MAALDLHAREQLAQEGCDDLLHRHVALIVREAQEPGQQGWDLDAGEAAVAPLGVTDHHRQV